MRMTIAMADKMKQQGAGIATPAMILSALGHADDDVTRDFWSRFMFRVRSEAHRFIPTQSSSTLSTA